MNIAQVNIADVATLPPYGNSTLPAGIRSRHIDNNNGLMVHVLEAGFETPGRQLLLLLHGFPELAYSWRKVMLPLAAAGYHVIAPDQRGYGRTLGWDGSYDADPDPFRIFNMVRDATGTVFALGYRSVAGVVGHDAGSPVASWCALIRPDIFRKLALMSSPFPGPPKIGFNTANGAAPPPPPYTDDQLDAELAKLPRPRKYYRNHQRTRGANDDMLHAPQGLHDFFRAYYHYKSADWKGNKPHPLKGAYRRGDGEDADLLRDGQGQGHGRQRRAVHAVARKRSLPASGCPTTSSPSMPPNTKGQASPARCKAIVCAAAPIRGRWRSCARFPAALSTCPPASSPARATGGRIKIPVCSKRCSRASARTGAARILSTAPATGRSRSSQTAVTKLLVDFLR